MRRIENAGHDGTQGYCPILSLALVHSISFHFSLSFAFSGLRFRSRAPSPLGRRQKTPTTKSRRTNEPGRAMICSGAVISFLLLMDRLSLQLTFVAETHHVFSNTPCFQQRTMAIGLVDETSRFRARFEPAKFPLTRHNESTQPT